VTDEARPSRRVLPPWTWPALDRLEQRIGEVEQRLDGLTEASHHVRHQADQMGHLVQQVHDMVAAINHRSTQLDEIAHLTRHLDERFNLVRDEVEIISALTLALQRQAEHQRLVEPTGATGSPA
jgi:ABC-type transporter Mla subunit MlaD